jgi:hypothetical protein
VTQVQIHVWDRGRGPRLLQVVTTDDAGYFEFTTRNRHGRRWSVNWLGREGPPARAFAF